MWLTCLLQEQFGTNIGQKSGLNQECDQAKNQHMGFIIETDKNKKLLKFDNGGDRKIEMIKDESQSSLQKDSDSHNCKDCFNPRDCKQAGSR